VKKKYIEIAWHHPVPNVERFDADKFKLNVVDGVYKLLDSDGHLVRIFPGHRVDLVQFGEEEVPERAVGPLATGPRVVKGPALEPDIVVTSEMPNKFQDQ